MIETAWVSAGASAGWSLGRPIVAGAPFAAAGVVALLLLAARPAVTGRTVLAAVPWGVGAAGLATYADVASYSPIVRSTVVGFRAYLVVFALAGLVWLAMRALGVPRRTSGDLAAPLFAVGSGLAVVLIWGALAVDGSVDLGRLSLLVILPVVAATVAGIVYVCFGLCYTDAVVYTGVAGSLLVFGHVLDAMATALAVTGFEGAGASTLAAGLATFAVAIDLPGRLGVDGVLALSWLLVWFKLAAAVLVVAAVARYARDRPARSNVVLGGIGIAGIVPGVATLLTILVGG